tara:strand:- start:113 stop:418 length:306 start_codon:yes stop_codon:yes gene_type:complete
MFFHLHRFSDLHLPPPANPHRRKYQSRLPRAVERRRPREPKPRAKAEPTQEDAAAVAEYVFVGGVKHEAEAEVEGGFVLARDAVLWGEGDREATRDEFVMV